MPNKKISDFTAKGAILAATDLIEISESNGQGGYNTKSVTGANVLSSKQDTLQSGTNIKTINSTTLLGAGDFALQPTLQSGTNIKTINSTTLLGAGDVAVQPTLVSGTNIKTINSTTILGSGNLPVQDTLVSGTNIKTINGSTVLGSGNLVVGGGPSYQAVSNTLGTIITGTTNAISDFLLLPANTLSSNCQFELQWYPRKTNSETATTQGLVYINSINSLTGATLFATGASMSTAGLFQVTLRRTVCVRSNVATLISTSTQTGSDFSTSLYSDVAFNNSSDIYFLFVMNNTGPLLASRNAGYRLLGYNL